MLFCFSWTCGTVELLATAAMAVVAGSLLLSPFTSALAVVDSSSARDACGFSCYTASTTSSAFFRGGAGAAAAERKRLRLSSTRSAQAHAGLGRQEAGSVSATMTPPRPSLNPETGAAEEDRREQSEKMLREEDEAAAFVWRDHWYPVSLIQDLDPSAPTSFQLLGRELVVWKDRQGEWRVFVDKCPHRLAPLSVRFTSPPSSFLSCLCFQTLDPKSGSLCWLLLQCFQSRSRHPRHLSC